MAVDHIIIGSGVKARVTDETLGLKDDRVLRQAQDTIMGALIVSGGSGYTAAKRLGA